MAGGTVDSLNVKIGLDATSVKDGVKDVNNELNKLRDRNIPVNLTITTKSKQAIATVDKHIQATKKRLEDAGLEIPIKIKVNRTGEFGAAGARNAVKKALAEGGGIPIKIKVDLDAASASTIRDSIRRQIGTVTIDFDWRAAGPPPPPPGGGQAAGGTGQPRGGGGQPRGGGTGGGGRQTGGGGGRQTGGGGGASTGGQRQGPSSQQSAPNGRGSTRTEYPCREPGCPHSPFMRESARDEHERRHATQSPGATGASSAPPPEPPPAAGQSTGPIGGIGTRPPERVACPERGCDWVGNRSSLSGHKSRKHRQTATGSPAGGTTGQTMGTTAPVRGGGFAGRRGDRRIGPNELKAEQRRAETPGPDAFTAEDWAEVRRQIQAEREGFGADYGATRGGEGGPSRRYSGVVPPTRNPDERLRQEKLAQERFDKELESLPPDIRAMFKGGGGDTDLSLLGDIATAFSEGDRASLIATARAAEPRTRTDARSRRKVKELTLGEDYPDLKPEQQERRRQAFINEMIQTYSLTSLGGIKTERTGGKNRLIRPGGDVVDTAHTRPERGVLSSETMKPLSPSGEAARKRGAAGIRTSAFMHRELTEDELRDLGSELRAKYEAERLARPWQEGMTLAYASLPPWRSIRPPPPVPMTQRKQGETWAQARERQGLAEGGLFSRPFGQSFGGSAEHRNVAKENTYEWKKARGAQIRSQPWCSACGMGRGEAARLGTRLTADKIKPSVAGGNPFDPSNLDTLCLSCNSAKSGSNIDLPQRWDAPRPGNILMNPLLAGLAGGPLTRQDFLPGGRLFGVKGIREARKALRGRAEGGTLAERLAQVRHAGVAQKTGTSVTMVGERGPEAVVQDENGNAEVIPSHKVDQFIPEWRKRAMEGKGFGKDMTRGFAAGGTFRGRLMAEPGSGSGTRGRFSPRTFRDAFEGEREAIGGGQLSPTGGVQRVFVVNWPQGTSLGGPGASPQVAQQMAQAAQQMAQAAQQMAQAARQMHQAGGQAPRQRRAQGAPAGGAAAGPGVAAQPGVNPAAGAAGQIGRAAGSPYQLPYVPDIAGQRAAAREESLDPEKELVRIQAGISEKQSLTPVRALSVSFGQIISQLTGRAQVQERARLAAKSAARAGETISDVRGLDRSLAALADRREYLNKLRDEGVIKAEQELELDEGIPSALKEQTYYREQALVRQKEALAVAKQEEAAILQRGDVAKNLAAGTIGITAGTLAFSLAFNLANETMQALGQEAGKAAERMLGYRETMVQVTRAVGDQTRAQDGASRAAVFATTAQAGLAAEVSKLIAPGLERRGLAEGGAKAFAEQLQLIQASVRATSEDRISMAGGQIGPFQPRGGIAGFTAGTGGFMGSPLGQTPGMMEQLATAAGYGPAQNILRDVAKTGALGLGGMALFGNEPEILTTEQIAAKREAARQQEAEIAAADYGPFNVLKKKPGKVTEQVEEEVRPSEAVNLALTDFEGNLKKANGSFVMLRKGMEGWTPELQKASDITLGLVGATEDELKVLQGAAFVDRRTGEAISGRGEAMRLVEQEARGAVTPDIGDLLAQLEGSPGRMGTAEIAQRAIRREGEYERRSLIPASTALRFMAQPQVAYNDPRLRPSENMIPDVKGSQAGFAQQSSAYSAAFEKYSKPAIAAQTHINKLIAEGGKELADTFHVPQALTSEIASLGKAIQDIQLGIQQRGLNLQVAEYNNQLRIARRSLKDARDFQAGIAGATKETLGGLEGQNAAMSRQLQLLQFELQQRQINFKVAIAGFQAPGLTSEERQARIDQAKLEASYAQKQLDLQKQIAANQFKGVSITASRSVQDLVAQIGLLQQGRALTIDTAAAEQAVKLMTDQQNALMEQAQSFFGEGQKQAQAVMATLTEFEAKAGKAIGKYGDDIVDVFQRAGNQAAKAIVGMLETVASYGGGGGATSGGGGAVHTRNAPGYLGMVDSATSMTVGEANGEFVAVLRNPKTTYGGGGGGGGGGGSMINVYVTGNSVRSDTDLEDLANRVARKVQKALNSQSSLVGLRNLSWN